MTRQRFYIGVGVAFVSGLILIVNFPDVALAVLTPAVPAVIFGAALATVYLYRVYRRQPEPRSRFWLMLLETFLALLAVGGWVGYLSVARLLERMAEAGQSTFTLPAPTPTTSAPISALIVIVVFASPIRFALETWAIRRRAPRRVADRDVTSNHRDE